MCTAQPWCAAKGGVTAYDARFRGKYSVRRHLTRLISRISAGQIEANYLSSTFPDLDLACHHFHPDLRQENKQFHLASFGL